MEAMDNNLSVDSQLWYACAGKIVKIPECNNMVYYFPQGHAEHSSAPIDYEKLPPILPCVLCRVADVRLMADRETDEVFAKIMLIPVKNNQQDFGFGDNQKSEDGVGVNEKVNSFPKTLTQSDANNGGGFSVPRYLAETIFPPLDYEADPPVQNICCIDVHGKQWQFRHIYRGTPRRHLLTTGWSTFVNQKKLVAGDSIVFLRSENGQIYVGIRRAKKGYDSNGNFGSGKGKVRPECVIEAANLAAKLQPFEVVYYPRTSSPEFCVKATSVCEAMEVQWNSGLRIKMAFETEDPSRISWFMGIVSSVHVIDPIRWPRSPWKLLQVKWDESDSLETVKSVSPWSVELVPSMPLSPFSPPRKKSRLLPHFNFPYESQFSIPSFSCNPLESSSFFYSVSNEIPSGNQGAGHVQFSAPTPFRNIHLDSIPPPLSLPMDSQISNEDDSLELNMGQPGQKKPKFVLFGRDIFITEHEIIINSRDAISPILNGNSSSSSSNGILEETTNVTPDSSSHEDDFTQKTRHCKVFMESEDIGRTLDLSVLGSYEELYKKLADMFDEEPTEMLSHVSYRDETGAVKHAGEEPFTKFVNTAKRLTISRDRRRF